MTTKSARWYEGVSATRVTHALGMALKHRVDFPARLLAIAVVGQAFCDQQPVDMLWLDLADIDPDVMGIRVAMPETSDP